MKPPRSILDPAFQYTNSAQTSLARTFARLRREQKAKELRKPSETVIDIGKERRHQR